MSSFLPNVIVTQALKDVKSSSIRNTNELPKKVQKGLDRLYAYQHDDGGWGWWKDDQSDPFMTAYVVNGLTLAKQNGYQPDEARIASGREKLKQMLDSGTTEAGTAIDLETRAFMVYALEESGDVDNHHLEKIFSERGNLQPYGRALLALTLKQRKDDKRARDVAAEIERTRHGRRFLRALGVAPQSNARLRRNQRHRSHGAFVEGPGADQARQSAPAARGALARFESAQQFLLGVDERYGVCDLRTHRLPEGES